QNPRQGGRSRRARQSPGTAGEAGGGRKKDRGQPGWRQGWIRSRGKISLNSYGQGDRPSCVRRWDERAGDSARTYTFRSSAYRRSNEREAMNVQTYSEREIGRPAVNMESVGYRIRRVGRYNFELQ